jgi:hypothetical protein
MRKYRSWFMHSFLNFASAVPRGGGSLSPFYGFGKRQHRAHRKTAVSSRK